MSTNVKPPQGRHRAPVKARRAVPPTAVRALGGVTLALALLVTWQVL
ncbi:hypothetical protein [Nocardioides panacihumi]